MNEEPPAVLVVDDQPELADLFGTWLVDDYRVRTAYGGGAAIDALDESVDVALVDRSMPNVSGDEVLEYVRTEGFECRVAMVTAVDPDFDIVDMGFDEYVVKPVRRDDLTDLVAALVSRSTYDDKLQEFYALASKRAALQARKDQSELECSDTYSELTDQIETMRSEIEQTTEQLTVRDFEAELQRLNADSSA